MINMNRPKVGPMNSFFSYTAIKNIFIWPGSPEIMCTNNIP